MPDMQAPEISMQATQITQPDILPAKAILKAGDVAAVLGVGTSRVHQMIRAGELPSIRVGKRGRRVPARAFAQWLEAKNQEASASVQPVPTPSLASLGQALEGSLLSEMLADLSQRQAEAAEAFQTYFVAHYGHTLKETPR